MAYTGLKLKVPERMSKSGFTYDVVVEYYLPNNISTTMETQEIESNLTFHKNGSYFMTEIFDIDRHIEQVTFSVKFDGIYQDSYVLIPTRSKIRLEKKLKTTPADSQKDPNTVKEVIVGRTEVAWYLMKESEDLDGFLRRIYQYTPGATEERIFRNNNPHLRGTPLFVLEPGDVVIIANTDKENSELRKMKQLAKKAKDELNKLKRNPNFDARVFAYNADFMHEMLEQADYVALTNSPVQVDRPKNIPKPPSIDYGAIAKGTADGIIGFYGKTNENVTKAYNDIVKAMEAEKKQGTRLANPKNFSEFKRKYAHLFRKFDSAFSQSFFKYETGIQTSNLRRQINQNVFARRPNYKGGLDAYLKNWENMGKITRFTAAGGNVLLAMDVANAGIEVNKAYKTGDSDHTRKTVIKETLKLEGSIGGAGLGAYAAGGLATLVFGASTGGLGFIVVGICAAGGGLAGGYFGGKGGEALADTINNNW